MSNVIVSFPGYDVTNFEIYPIKLFSYMTKKPEQKFKYLVFISSFLKVFQ